MAEQIPAKQLVALVTGKVKSKQRAQDAMSHIASKIKEAGKNAHLNKAAFDVVFKAYKMDEDDRDMFFDAIALYRDFMDENNAWADGEHTGDLVKNAEAETKLEAERAAAEIEKKHDDQVKANIVALKRGISKLDPKAEGMTDDMPAAENAAEDIDNIPEALERRPSRIAAREEEKRKAAAEALSGMVESATSH